MNALDYLAMTTYDAHRQRADVGGEAISSRTHKKNTT